ncbi:MAG: tRNA preQ1(34) S-adenosylmethionine ribosyltransferase-isomerase QueA [Planctomycetaceae bacterium]
MRIVNIRNMDELKDYDYQLPPDRIAQHPLSQRDAARLMVVGRNGGSVRHRRVCDLPEFLQAGDCLVLNDTRVVPARLFGTREATGGKWEGLFLSADAAGRWRLIGQTRGRLQAGERLAIRRAKPGPGRGTLLLTLESCDDHGVWTARPTAEMPWKPALDEFGTVPLPPYIQRSESESESNDRQRYQTVFARHPGAVAAPTAGLHFTPKLLETIRTAGVQIAFVTLHVGVGTFRPIEADRLSGHTMHWEWCRLSTDVAGTLNRLRSRGGRIFAVGTTALRTLESSYDVDRFEPFEGETNLFLRPPYSFPAVDGLLTNFHLPKSSLFVLVCALLGRRRAKSAYGLAIREGYRFFSYGDAMLIV